MAADPKGVLTGVHFLDGDQACCEGALAAGARFAAGYPITPCTEIVERFAARIPTVGGTFIQMEDELAASITILGAVWGGAKAFFGGEGLIMLEARGTGTMWMASYGAIHLINVTGAYTVDTSHIVAFDESLTFNVTKIGGMKSLFLSQEGLVCRFTGNGRLWIQTRNAPALASFFQPFRRIQAKN